MRRLGYGLILVAVLAGGCEGPPIAHRIDYIQVMTPLAASNLDGKPGPDGVQVRVFFYRSGQKVETVAGTGTLEILMFDGNLTRADLTGATSAAPLGVWSYTPQELQLFQARWKGLWCYQLILPWGKERPRSGGVTLMGRYREKDGLELHSRPQYVPSGLR